MTASSISTESNTVSHGVLRERAARWLPQIVLTPSLLATFLYVFLFSAWTIWISLSNSSLLPDYKFVGFKHYGELWQNHRWTIAYTNLFIFGTLYVTGTAVIGLALAIIIDQRVRAEALWRTIYLYPVAVSFVVTGTVWRWIFNPASGIEAMVHGWGWAGFHFDWIASRDMAIYTVVITGIWNHAGFCMVLFLAGLRSVDQDLIKAAQIDGASMARIYRRIIIPSIRPIIIAALVVLLQFAIKTFDLVQALTTGGPGISTQVPAIYVYDLMFQRGQLAEGAAGAIMILLALAAVLVPYGLWRNYQRRREVARV
ncbi:MAG TPA: sugar ABC transporter permease [Magnetospirillaceae bacterium]|jgi:glucose/mannose transport system permease protein